jgi:TolB-like protein/Flp pilus assembly protein TadD
VLPFEEIGRAPGDAYFGDGISEELIDVLSRVARLRVAGRTSSFAFRDQAGDVRGIGKALGVTSILTGSVQRSSNRIRVRAQLADASSGFTVWSETYDSDLTDIFAVQDKISHAIVSALSLRLGASEASAIRTPPTNIDAYDQYLQGVYAWNQRGPGILRSIAYFKKSIALDSSYAPAFAGIAEAYLVAADWSMVSAPEVIPLSRANAMRALALDSLSAEAHLALAVLRCHHEYDFAGADQEYRRAIALNPSFGTAHYQYGWCLSGLGRFDAAVAEVNKARDLDPLNPQLLSALGKAYYLQRRPADGLTLYETGAKLPTDAASRYFWTAYYYRSRGDTARAFLAARKGVAMSGDAPLYSGAMATIYALGGRTDSARAILARLERLANHPSYHIAATYAALRDDDIAVDWLERAYAERSDWLPAMRYDPVFDRLRENPRFTALEQRIQDHPRQP